ncbi:DUF5753 domain-containing protein [Spirillospora sp. NPDC127200]
MIEKMDQAGRPLDPARSLWDLIAVELRRQIYVNSTSQAGVARLLDCTRSHVTRLVTGSRHMTPKYATILDQEWGLRNLFTHLVAHAYARPEDDWLTSLSSYEASATSHHLWSLNVVPGLLQTPAYARAQLEEGRIAGLLPNVDKALKERLTRQAAVWDRSDSPRVTVVLSWIVLMSVAGGPQVMREQLAHLLELGERPAVSVRVVGQHAGVHVGSDGAFKLLTVGKEMAFAEAPGRQGRLVLDPERVQEYTRRFERINDLAWSVAESREAIEKARDGYA